MIDEALSRFHVSGVCPRVSHSSCVCHLLESSNNNSCETSHPLEEKLGVLSSISNSHKYKFNTKGSQRTAQKTSFSQHLLYDPCGEVSERSGKFTQRYLPSSPRNRLMFFTFFDDPASRFSTAKLLLHDDMSAIVEGNPGLDAVDYAPEPEPAPAPAVRKRRRPVTRAIPVNVDLLSRSVHLEQSYVENSASLNRTIYTEFSEQIVSDGDIIWRKHDADLDVVVMSDISADTGYIRPSSFVHVTASLEEDTGELMIQCTCQLYEIIQRAAREEIDILPEGVVAVLDTAFTCMHCRLFKEHLVDCVGDLQRRNESDGLSAILAKVKDSLDQMDQPLVLLGSPIPNGTSKFSARSEEEASISVVHVTFTHGKCLTRCLNSACASLMRNKKKVDMVVNLEECKKVCGHLKTLLSNWGYVKSLFPEHVFGQSSSSDQQHMVPENTDNIEVVSKFSPTTWFDTDKGLWQSKALSTHKPMDQFDDMLNSHTHIRNEFCSRANFNSQTGTYDTMKLIPPVRNSSGDPFVCACGVSACGLSFFLFFSSERQGTLCNRDVCVYIK